MRLLNHLSIRSKLIFLLLSLSTFSIFVTAIISYRSGKTHLTNRVFKQLTSLRTAKEDQIESYFDDIYNQTEVLSENLMVVSAMQEFKAAYQKLQTPETELPQDANQRINAYYQENFLNRLALTQKGKPLLSAYKPKNPAAIYLQYHYLVANSYPLGEKHLWENPGDGSEYSQLHARYHRVFRNITDKFGYYDLFLIEPETGAIVYSVSKETDFATSLNNGPYSDSNLAAAVTDVKQAKEQSYIKLVDFAPYRPSYGAPAAFLATPIYDGSQFIGVLAIQLPVGEINTVMTGFRKWRDNGLGESGEIYLVGSDHLMRSISRFLIQDKKNYLQALQDGGIDEQTLTKIEQFQTSILQQEINTEPVEGALSGKRGTQITTDYRGVQVLSSYAPLKIGELKWAIISQMDLAEAYAPVYALQKRVLISAVFLILLLTLIAMGLSHGFTKPINTLIANARKVRDGKVDAVVNLDSTDEFGELATSFNEMVGSLRTQTALVEQKNRENEALLFSVFPESVAKRLKRGEKDIAESVNNVTVLFADIAGFGKLSKTLEASEVINILNDLVTVFDQAAQKHGLEKIKTIGDNYMAVCGLSVPHLDHHKRAVDLALEMLSLTHRFSHEREYQLDLQVGIHCGDVFAGTVGRNKIVYDVWGNTVNIANRLKEECPEGGILVSPAVYHSLHDLYEFEQVGEKLTNGQGKQGTWLVKGVRKALKV